MIFFGSSVNIRYCRSAVTQKSFLTGPGTLRRSEQRGQRWFGADILW